MQRKTFLLILGLLALLFLAVGSFASAWAAPAQPECSYRTGHNASLILVEPEARGIASGDVLRVTSDGECFAEQVAGDGNQALAVWEDDPVTAATDGAAAGDALTLEVHRSGLLLSAETLAEPYGRDEIYELPAPANDSLLAVLDALHAELLEAVAYIEMLEEQNAALAAALDELEAQVEPLQIQVAELQEERDQALAERDAAFAERDAAIEERDAALAALEPLQRVIDDATIRALASYQLLFDLDFPAGPGESP